MHQTTLNRIVSQISTAAFMELVSEREVVVGTHARDHLSIAQREVYREDQLVQTIKHETPVLVGVQQNKRYAAFYRRDERYLKLIIADKTRRLELVTFINSRVLPSLARNP